MSKKITVLTIYSVSWTNPYQEPPQNAPKTLVWDFLAKDQNRNNLSAKLVDKAKQLFPNLKDQLGLGRGYSISVNFHEIKKPTVMKAEIVLTMRKKRTIRRIQKQTPLLFEQEYQRELLENPNYFNLESIEEKQKERLKIKTDLWSSGFENEPNQLSKIT
jgi:hypothetical protein